MKRTLITLVAGATTLVAAVGVPATADSAPLSTSYAAAAKVTPGSGIAPNVTTGGALGGLLDFLTPVLDQVVNPLTAQLTALSGTVVGDLAGALTGAGLAANSPGTPQSPPASGYPDCASGGWTNDTCFGPLVPTISAAPLLSLGSGTLQGYAAADPTGSYAKARTAGIALNVLGVSLGNLGVAESSAQCVSQVCAGQSSLTGLSLLGGAVAARTGDDGTLQVSLNGSSFTAPSAYSSPTTLSGAGVSATAQAQGGLLKITVGLGLDQLLTAVGIPDVLAGLNASGAGSTISLTVTIGAGSSTSGDSASAAGLEIGLGLSANISISVLGLVTVGVSAPDTSATGNLIDLRLAYTTAANAQAPNPSGAPPNLT